MISAECDSPNLCDSPFRGEKSEIATYEIARVESILQKLLSLYPELEVEAGLDPLDSIHFAIEQISSIVHEKQSLDSKNELRFIVHEAVQEVASQMRGEMRETILSTPAFQTPSATPAPPTPLPSNINLENQINFLEGQVQNLKSDLDRTESDAKILVQDAQRKLNMSNVQTELIETLLVKLFNLAIF